MSVSGLSESASAKPARDAGGGVDIVAINSFIVIPLTTSTTVCFRPRFVRVLTEKHSEARGTRKVVFSGAHPVVPPFCYELDTIPRLPTR
jgi:hypothetical protein